MSGRARAALPFALCAGAFVAASVWAVWNAAPAGDLLLFGHAGDTLLSPRALDTFADPGVQAGVFELGLVGVLQHAFGASQQLFAAATAVASACAILAATWALVGRRALALAIVGGGSLLLGLVADPYTQGHPAELAIALLWLLAAREAQRGRVARAAVIVGLSTGFELWGALGVAVLALAPRLRAAAAWSFVAGGLGALLLAPFALFGDFRMFEYDWSIVGGVPGLLFGVGEPFTWQLRVLEGATVVALAGTVARLARRHGAAVWLVPAAASLCRVALDPIRYGYYWDTELLVMLIGIAALVVSSAFRPLGAQTASRIGYAARASTQSAA